MSEKETALRLHDGSLWRVYGASVEQVAESVQDDEWIVASGIGPLYRENATTALVRCSAVVAVVRV
jgi:hypothetical protein